MKLLVNHSIVYDLDNDNDLWNEYLDGRDGYPNTFESLKEFILDRFINPNFDMGGRTTIEFIGSEYEV